MERPRSLNNSLNDVKYEQYINNLHSRLPSLVDPNDIDKNRWPWELIQNAKDTVVRRPIEERFVDIIFKYYIGEDGHKKLRFEHNGDQFTNKAITGLIWKFSAEKRDEQITEDELTRDKQSTGRFGTGFMTTHALSLTVDISGSMFNDDEDVNRNVSVDFTLHREGPTDQQYREGVNRTESEMKLDERLVPEGGILPTSFTYHLKNEVNESAAEVGLNNVRQNAAQTMLFCPSIRSISIDDEINQNQFKIYRQKSNNCKDIVKETMFIEESTEKGKPTCRKFVSIEIDEPSDILSSYWKVENRNQRLHVAVEVDEEKNNIISIPSSVPSVYCSLPLVGYERMSLPFYINSNDFEPNEPRTELYIKQKRTKKEYNIDTNTEYDVVIQNGINWSILERSISLYERIVDYLIDNGFGNRFNLINGLGKVLEASWTAEEKNCLAARFILPLRKMLANKRLVRTSTQGEYRSISSNIKFVECSKEYNREEFYDLCVPIYGDDIPIKEENQSWVDLKWGKYSFPLEFEEKKTSDDNPSFPIIKYTDVAEYVEEAGTIDGLKLVSETDKLEWLNRLYQWISNSKISNLAERSIVPNRLGIFCNCVQGCDLRDASDIPLEVFNFMKKLQLDWDEQLLMEGVNHITLQKETKDNIVIAIKQRSKEIENSGDDVLNRLLPLLMALPKNDDGRTHHFFNKRNQIISIIKTMYPHKTEGVDSIVLDLSADMWESADKWFMNYAAHEIANRKKIDDIDEDNLIDKYCTAEWLSNTVNFMFEHGYLHQEDIISKDNGECLEILPNRHGDFQPLSMLYRQGDIPDQLLDDTLSKTGFDIKTELLYNNFSLNDKITISNYSLSGIAQKYNSFFGEEKNEGKEEVADYLIHLIPECGDQFCNTRLLYNKYKKATDTKTEVIPISDLKLWEGANTYLITFLADEASNLGSINKLGIHLNQDDDSNDTVDNIGLSWLNSLAEVIKNSKIDVNENCKIVPDWHGELQHRANMTYNGRLLKEFKYTENILNIIEGDLWNYFNPDEDDYPKDKYCGVIKKIVNPDYIFVKEFQENTNNVVFDLVDRMIDNCSKHVSAEWILLFTKSVKTLLDFFDANERKTLLGYDDSKLGDFFKRTYQRRKEFTYDYIFDKETKERISELNDNFSVEEIEELIKEHVFVKDLLYKKEHYESLEEENKKLRQQNDDLMRQLDLINGDIIDDVTYANSEEGNWGESIVWEELKKEYPEKEGFSVIWASRDYNEPCYDFKVEKNGDVISYFDAKTTARGLANADSIPFFMRKSQWMFLNRLNDNIPYYIARVFISDNNLVKYFRISEKKEYLT